MKNKKLNFTMIIISFVSSFFAEVQALTWKQKLGIGAAATAAGLGLVVAGGKVISDHNRSVQLSPSQINQPIMDPLAGRTREEMRELQAKAQAMANERLAEHARKNLPQKPKESMFGDPHEGIDPEMLRVARAREEWRKSESEEDRAKRFAEVDKKAKKDIAEKKAARTSRPKIR